MIVTILVLGVILLARLSKQQLNSEVTWPAPSVNLLGVYYKAAVAAENGICSEVGRDVMIRNGNAVDAAVAATFCMSVMNPQHNGMGGGHFMTIFLKASRQCITIDASMTAPKRASKYMYNNHKLDSTTGWGSVAVPGELHGLWTAHSRYGRLSWSSLLAPTISLLENGIAVSSALAKVLQKTRNVIETEPTLKIFINNATGQVYRAGEIMKRPVLAATLRQLANAKSPLDLFYNGTMAQKIANEFQTNGGLLKVEDFAAYSSIIRKPITTDLSKNLWSCGPPPPSSAVITHFILNLLAGYSFTEEKLSTISGNVDAYHKLIESMKFAYTERSKLGDMDFIKDAMNISNLLLNKEYVEKVRSRITDRAHSAEYYGDTPKNIQDYGTTHISIVDADGNAVAVTSTINLEFGSKRRSESTGIIWNDQMDDFSIPGSVNAFGFAPSSTNYIEPGKRPMSSMSPTVIFNDRTGQVRLVIGAAGGSRIISGIANTAARILFFNQTVKGALDRPRLHNQLIPDYTEVEPGFPKEYMEALAKKGQNLKYGYNSISAVTAVERHSNGMIYAYSDSRKGAASYPAGF